MRYAAAGGSPEEARGERLKNTLNALVLIGSAVEAAAGVLRRLRCARHAIHRNL